MTGSPAELPYRQGVGIMVLDRRGRVFVGRRIDTTAEAWQMPQGGIDDDEDARDAALRELREETGIDKVEVIAESAGWYCYDLPAELVGKVWRGRYRGQRQKWFVMRFEGDDGDIDIRSAHPEFEAWKWLPMDKLMDSIVPFKRALYKELIAEFGHLTHPG